MMQNAIIGQCRGCTAPVIWAVMVKTENANPLDAEPVANGNIRILRDPVKATNFKPIAQVVSKEHPAREGEELYVSHFVTCPEAKRFGYNKSRKGGRP
jgi:hypothetical protein